MPPAEPKCDLGTHARKGLKASAPPPFELKLGISIHIRMDLAGPKVHLMTVPEYVGNQPYGMAHEESQALRYDSLWSPELTMTMSPQQDRSQPACPLESPQSLHLPPSLTLASVLPMEHYPTTWSSVTHTAARTARRRSQASPAHTPRGRGWTESQKEWRSPGVP